MFNPYSFQGGTATLDPQACGTNGHARIQDVAATFNPTVAGATLTGIPVGQPNPAVYGYQNIPTSQVPFATYAPTTYGIPAYQPTPFGYAPVPTNPWAQPISTPFSQTFSNPYATMNPYAGYNPFINQSFNPYAGYPTTIPMNTVNPYTGTPSWFPTNIAPNYSTIPNPYYGTIPTPVNPMAFLNPFTQVRPGYANPMIGAWQTPFTTPFNTINPLQQFGFASPFFSNPVNFPGLTNPLAQVAASVTNPLVGGLSPFVPQAIAPFANPALGSVPFGAGIDPITTSLWMNQSILNPAWGHHNAHLPFFGNVNPMLASRFGLNPFAGFNQYANTIPSNLLNPLSTFGNLNTFGGCTTPFANVPANAWNSLGSFASIPTTSPISNGFGGYGSFSNFGGFSPSSTIPGFGAAVNSCWPNCCI